MKIVILIISLLISFCSFSQDLTCSDFKNGTFYVDPDEYIPVGYKIIREGTSQIEIVQDPENKLGEDFNKTSYEIIEWIDDCTYRLKYDETKMKLSDYQQFLNDNNGILTELIKIDGKCMYIKSTLNVNGEIQRIDSKMCLE
ncbi:hypothetical protein [Aequorivita marisscotiae]|uniref:Uncharacterized protein n=1 Tax=Aequorivita marisscotiae TaxID=3040348 RepID=A0ABY8KWZ1_9FLAO|nr:hypothetical protein [Aequorivita sp. Ant34-E75]WGF93915.1 hypothetical protein QCQ61_06930 [Aequorivita sp. Ant34-E75]